MLSGPLHLSVKSIQLLVFFIEPSQEGVYLAELGGLEMAGPGLEGACVLSGGKIEVPSHG